MDCPQDISKAKNLLREAGYPNGIEMVIHVSTKEPTWPTIGEVLQQQLAKAGIKAEVKMTPSKLLSIPSIIPSGLGHDRITLISLGNFSNLMFSQNSANFSVNFSISLNLYLFQLSYNVIIY